MSDLTAVSLFAGIGGFDCALERAGVHVAAAVEIDSACRGVLRRHFPQTTVFNDVTEVTGDRLRAAGFVPGRGILCAGWPCQGNSVAGRRKGMADPRSGLWRHVVRLVAETRPRWFLGENVPGLLSINGGRDFGTVLRDLDDLGYGVAWRVLDAQWFGVPQRRRRVFLAGCLGDGTAAAEVLFEPEGGERDSAPGRPPGARIAGTLAASAGGGGLGGAGQSVSSITSRLVETASTLQGGGRRGYRVDAEGAAGGHLVAVPIQDGRDFEKAQNRLGIGDPGAPSFTLDTTGAQSVAVATLGGEGVEHALTSEGADASEDGTGRGTPIVAYALTSRNSRNSREENYITFPIDLRNAARDSEAGEIAGTGIGQDGDPSFTLSATARALPGVATAVGFAENQRGELVESAISHQLTTGGGKPGQGFLAVRQETLVRRLTPLECERLQGFPDDWTRWDADGNEQSDSARYRQLGNAVAVPVAEWIAHRVVAADQASAAEGAA